MIMGLGCLSENWEIQVRRDQCVEYFEGTLVIQISINKSKPARLNNIGKIRDTSDIESKYIQLTTFEPFLGFLIEFYQ